MINNDGSAGSAVSVLNASHLYVQSSQIKGGMLGIVCISSIVLVNESVVSIRCQ